MLHVVIQKEKKKKRGKSRLVNVPVTVTYTRNMNFALAQILGTTGLRYVPRHIDLHLIHSNNVFFGKYDPLAKFEFPRFVQMQEAYPNLDSISEFKSVLICKHMPVLFAIPIQKKGEQAPQ